MRGFAIGGMIMMTILAIMVLSVIILGITIHSSGGVIKKVVVQRDIYTIKNSLAMAELYLNASLPYAVYQALFDIGLNGGQVGVEDGYVLGDRKYAYWRKDRDLSPTQEGFEKALSKMLKPHLNKYTEKPYTFLSGYEVGLPKYESVEVGYDNKTLEFKTEEKIISVEKVGEDYVRLARGVELSYGIEYSLFKLAKDFVSEDRLGTEIYNYLIGWAVVGESGCDEKEPSDLEVFNKANSRDFRDFTEAESFIKGETGGVIENLTKQLNNNTENITWTITPQGGATGIKHNCKLKKDGSCTKTCSFSYQYSANVTLDVADRKTARPVKNRNKVLFEYISLSFAEAVEITNPPEIEA